jgi:hypothetical protein
MPFEWLDKLQKETLKREDYAAKTLAQYRLGMKAKGSIAGVRVLADPHGCAACRTIAPETVYHPDEAPQLPLPDCEKGRRCQCVYRPVMTYEGEDAG